MMLPAPTMDMPRPLIQAAIMGRSSAMRWEGQSCSTSWISSTLWPALLCSLSQPTPNQPGKALQIFQLL